MGQEKLQNSIGNDFSPHSLNASTSLQKGIHLHFVLPPAFKHGVKKNGSTTIEYPSVPDKYIVTRMYIDKSSKERIVDCNIVDSTFYTADTLYKEKSITIPFDKPFKDDFSNKHYFRYLGRQFSGFEETPKLNENKEEGHIKELFGIGPGDPLFNAYYPNCRSVFGYYDNLKELFDNDNELKTDKLTYSVIGYYSDTNNDPFSKIKTKEDMEEILKKFNFVADNDEIRTNCLLFGEVRNINLKEDNDEQSLNKPQSNNINVSLGIGRTSAEALSAIIYGIYSKKLGDGNTEQFLTEVQYDMVEEASQIDGQFKIEDSIHSYGFTSTDPIEKGVEISFSKDTKFKDSSDILSIYTELSKEQKILGKLKRELEFKKNKLYNLWELYLKNKDSDTVKNINELIKDIEEYRNNDAENPKSIPCLQGSIKRALENLENSIKNNIEDSEKTKVEVEEVSKKPFYYPKDPALMLFGKEIKNTFASKEEDQKKEPLYCLTSPLSSNDKKITNFKLNGEINNEEIASDSDKEGFLNLVVMSVLLDNDNSEQSAESKMVNNNPNEELILFMGWKTNFYNNYKDSNYTNGEAGSSSFAYGDTDYKYNGKKLNDAREFFGQALLTPHGINNLRNKLQKYNIDLYKELDNIYAVSQNLGGFTIDLASLRYAFQLPLFLYKDEISNNIKKCLFPQTNECNELDPERKAVCGTCLIPLREGFLNIKDLAIVTSFGNRKNVANPSLFYISENIRSNNDSECMLPLALTTPARLLPSFISAANESIPSCSLPGSSPIIALIMPDMLNRNMNIYDNKGMLLGVIKRCYNQKKVAGQFMQICDNEVYKKCDERIKTFINMLTPIEDNSYLSELMNIIDQKLDNTIPMYQNDFIFGRILALAEINIELEYYGGTEFVKEANNDNFSNDKGLMNQQFPVMIGDINRYSDGVICGFYGDKDCFENGFAPFGKKKEKNKYFNATHPMVSGVKPAKVMLLLDPSQKVTLSTGFLPVEQIQIDARHTDFSNMNLMSAVMDTLISEETKIQLPDFAKGEKFTREYPKLDTEKNNVNYQSIDVVKASSAIGIIGKTMITDGFILKQKQNNSQINTNN